MEQSGQRFFDKSTHYQQENSGTKPIQLNIRVLACKTQGDPCLFLSTILAPNALLKALSGHHNEPCWMKFQSTRPIECRLLPVILEKQHLECRRHPATLRHLPRARGINSFPDKILPSLLNKAIPTQGDTEGSKKNRKSVMLFTMFDRSR